MPGTTSVYTVVVSNAGPSAAADVSVIDNAPAGATITGWSCTGTPCPISSGSGDVNQTVATLASGDSVTYAITVAYPSGFDASVTNTATANSATTPDPTVGNNSASDTDTVVPTSDVAITKSQSTPNPALPGQTVTWTIVATNNGPSDAQMTVTDAVPASVTGLTLGGTNSASCAIAGQNVTCDFGTRSVGDTRTFTISGTLSVAATGSLSNTATITTTSTDSVPGNNSATSTTPIGATIDAVDDGPTTLPVTHCVRCSAPLLTATNNGPATVTGAIVRDTVGAGLTCPATNAVTCAGTSCPATALTVADLTGTNGVTLGEMINGAKAVFTFNCAVQ